LPRSQAAENAAFSIGLDEGFKMATVQEMKATARPKGGKGPPGQRVAPAKCRA